MFCQAGACQGRADQISRKQEAIMSPNCPPSLCNALDEKSPLRRVRRRQQLWHLWPRRRCRSRSGRTCLLLMKLHRLKKAESVGDSVSLSLSQQRIGRFLVFSPSVPHSLLRLRFTFPRRRFMVLHSLRLHFCCPLPVELDS